MLDQIQVLSTRIQILLTQRHRTTDEIRDILRGEHFDANLVDTLLRIATEHMTVTEFAMTAKSSSEYECGEEHIERQITETETDVDTSSDIDHEPGQHKPVTGLFDKMEEGSAFEEGSDVEESIAEEDNVQKNGDVVPENGENEEQIKLQDDAQSESENDGNIEPPDIARPSSKGNITENGDEVVEVEQCEEEEEEEDDEEEESVNNDEDR